MEYLKLVKVYEALEKTTKRLEKTEIISNFIKDISAEELEYIIHLIEGSVFPESDERKIGMSSQLMLKVIARSTGNSLSEIEKEWKKKGDLGIVTENFVKEKKQRTLTTRELTTRHVYDNIRKLAELEGKGTVDRKVSLVSELLTSAKPEEARFIVRTILDEMRIGVSEGVVRDSIAKAFDIPVEEVEKTFNMLVDYGKVAVLAKKGKKYLNKIGLEPGRPTKVMLAILVNNVNEAFEYLGKPLQAEVKLDGFRCLINNDGKNIYLFTRRMENVTNQFKELIPIIKKQIKAKSYIIDSELVGYDPKTKKYLPFQSISQRIKRKYDIEEISKKFPVEINAFDIIYYNGKSIEKEPLKERRKVLEKIVEQKRYDIVLTKKLVTDNEKKANEFFKESIKEGYEGLVLKNLNAEYKPGRYVNYMCKMKQVLDPLDLVITGAQWGEGKRSEWLSSFTIACRAKDKFVDIGKVGTGIKEKSEGVTFKELTRILKPLITETKGKNIIVKPKIIVQVGYEEIQKSPTYKSGYALRFPKIIMLRNEKPLDEVSSINEVERIYKYQKGKK
ncbi:MAG: ATP-dependent DNA ligase [Nanoarchaeota archaeon]|nr:ATP-dependent DNA ligase [Nanoarchaeota archaeon]MBU0963375.1 ATP-dependent DNA ligase [Nanoarchaeota archaeon]